MKKKGAVEIPPGACAHNSAKWRGVALPVQVSDKSLTPSSIIQHQPWPIHGESNFAQHVVVRVVAFLTVRVASSSSIFALLFVFQHSYCHRVGAAIAPGATCDGFSWCARFSWFVRFSHPSLQPSLLVGLNRILCNTDGCKIQHSFNDVYARCRTGTPEEQHISSIV